jgi:hypothetical protein
MRLEIKLGMLKFSLSNSGLRVGTKLGDTYVSKRVVKTGAVSKKKEKLVITEKATKRVK